MGASPKRVSKTGGRNIVARPDDGPACSARRYWLGAVTVQDSQQQARRVIGAEIVAAGDQTRQKPRQSRTMARHGAFTLQAGLLWGGPVGFITAKVWQTIPVAQRFRKQHGAEQSSANISLRLVGA